MNDGASSCEGHVEEVAKPLSKRQQRKQRRHEISVAKRPEKRKLYHARVRKRRAEAKAAGIECGPSRKFLKTQQPRMSTSECKLRIVVDMSFEHLMTDHDLTKAILQLKTCYSVNRRAPQPLQYYITSVRDRVAEFMNIKSPGYTGWDVNVEKDDFLSIFPKQNIVYLTSDSPNILEQLDSEMVYVIGGLVDHNHHKGVTFAWAQTEGIAHAQLPISKYVKMATRQVLTVNHCFEILLRFTELNDWEKAFFTVLPKRKGAVAISDSNDNYSTPT